MATQVKKPRRFSQTREKMSPNVLKNVDNYEKLDAESKKQPAKPVQSTPRRRMSVVVQKAQVIFEGENKKIVSRGSRTRLTRKAGATSKPNSKPTSQADLEVQTAEPAEAAKAAEPKETREIEEPKLDNTKTETEEVKTTEVHPEEAQPEPAVEATEEAKEVTADKDEEVVAEGETEVKPEAAEQVKSAPALAPEEETKEKDAVTEEPENKEVEEKTTAEPVEEAEHAGAGETAALESESAPIEEKAPEKEQKTKSEKEGNEKEAESAPIEEKAPEKEQKTKTEKEENEKEAVKETNSASDLGSTKLAQVEATREVTVEKAPFGLTASNLLVIRTWGEAAAQGVVIGDKIVKVNGHSVINNRQMKEAFADSPLPFPMELLIGDEQSIAKAKDVLSRLEIQEQEQQAKDRILSRRNSEARSSVEAKKSERKDFANLSDKVLKKKFMGKGTRFLKLYNKCIFYAHEESAIDSKEKLLEIEKEYRQNLVDSSTLKFKNREKNVVIIPLDDITQVNKTSKGGFELIVADGKKKRKFNFEGTGGSSLYEKWSKAIEAHKKN